MCVGLYNQAGLLVWFVQITNKLDKKYKVTQEFILEGFRNWKVTRLYDEEPQKTKSLLDHERNGILKIQNCLENVS